MLPTVELLRQTGRKFLVSQLLIATQSLVRYASRNISWWWHFFFLQKLLYKIPLPSPSITSGQFVPSRYLVTPKPHRPSRKVLRNWLTRTTPKWASHLPSVCWMEKQPTHTRVSFHIPTGRTTKPHLNPGHIGSFVELLQQHRRQKHHGACETSPSRDDRHHRD